MRPALLLLLTALLPGLAVAAAFGEWELQRDAGTQQALLVVRVEGRPGAFGALVVRCEARRLSVFVDVGAPLVVGRPAAVRYQFDVRAIDAARWHPAPDGVGVFAPEAAPFARSLADLYHLTFAAMDAAGDWHTTDFPLTGSAAAIRPVLRACGDDS